MRISTLLQRTAILMVFVLFRLVATGQVRISGTVYDRSVRFGMPGVSVMSTSGAGTVTDSAGRYSIKLSSTDSLSFSYQGKATMKFPVNEIPFNRPFDVSLRVNIHVLPTVEVSAMRKSYQLDSLETRNEYRKVFDFAPDFLSGASSGAGVGVNLNMLFGMKKIKRMEVFKRRLEEYERDKYVDHRFNRDLVKRITGLAPPALDTFMIEYKPSYEMLQSFENEYEYYRYIQDWGEIWRRDHTIQR